LVDREFCWHSWNCKNTQGTLCSCGQDCATLEKIQKEKKLVQNMFLTKFFWGVGRWVIIALTTVSSTPQSQETSQKQPSLGLKPHLMIQV